MFKQTISKLFILLFALTIRGNCGTWLYSKKVNVEYIYNEKTFSTIIKYKDVKRVYEGGLIKPLVSLRSGDDIISFYRSDYGMSDSINVFVADKQSFRNYSYILDLCVDRRRTSYNYIAMRGYPKYANPISIVIPYYENVYKLNKIEKEKFYEFFDKHNLKYYKTSGNFIYINTEDTK